MTTPYTYVLKFIPTGQLYYGVRFREHCHPSELLVTYFSSSKIIKRLIQDNGVASFELQIRQTFINKKLARDWEQRFLLKVNAARNPRFINQSNNMKGILRDIGTYSWYYNPATGEKLLLKNSTPLLIGFIKGKRGPDPKQLHTVIVTHSISGKLKRIKQSENVPDGYIIGRKFINGDKKGTTYNTKWVCNDITGETRLLNIADAIPPGWHLGNKNIKNKDRVKITHRGICKSVYQQDLAEYLNNGWTLGAPTSQYVKIFRVINDIIETSQIHPADYKSAGWLRGLPILYKIYFTDGQILTYPYQWFVANMGISKDMILYAVQTGGKSPKFKFEKVERVI